MSLIEKLANKITHFLTTNVEKSRKVPLSDFKALCQNIVPCDVILVEGRSRSAKAINYITKSVWTHSAIYIGTVNEIPSCFNKSMNLIQFQQTDRIIIESNLGEGVIVTSLEKYKEEHIRICRPTGISENQKITVLEYLSTQIGHPYDARQIFDLARFFFPWWVLPRKWRSSLFQHNAQSHTKASCSLLIANAFINARFPIIPVIERKGSSHYFEAIIRNPRLFVPADFDYSPFFNIIKYPIIQLNGRHQDHITWDDSSISNDEYGITKSPS
ncbi:YiiX/YebB-like N1pC/P60 family cysteine hydrolase [Fangia hongkongensis]|uniref:YiiX/YebB-like N1pC/P60 family cysteine hydrolase n=1 Tax=Fangia hongkongensis TaxID=270495 RepID=UPI0003794174|nr:YiiX/YebB-like N1pC/P60 family cysteine hydrolase [Fangia hongkongensis]